MFSREPRASAAVILAMTVALARGSRRNCRAARKHIQKKSYAPAWLRPILMVAAMDFWSVTMPTAPLHRVLGHLRSISGNEEADGQLLESFLARRDDEAIEVIVRRHGPMVLGVCRRVLGNVHD